MNSALQSIPAITGASYNNLYPEHETCNQLTGIVTTTLVPLPGSLLT